MDSTNDDAEEVIERRVSEGNELYPSEEYRNPENPIPRNLIGTINKYGGIKRRGIRRVRAA